jgi:hypothetical protein
LKYKYQGKDYFQIVGVHTGGDQGLHGYNLGTFFDGFLELR